MKRSDIVEFVREHNPQKIFIFVTHKKKLLELRGLLLIYINRSENCMTNNNNNDNNNNNNKK